MSRNPTRPTFDEARERREQDGTEYQLGAILTSLFDVPHHERKNYRPIGETQRGVEDTQDCATRDYINDLETQHNYAYRNRFFIPEVKKFLDDNGYVVWRNGVPYVEYADAFIAIKSGTTKQGNSLKAPAQAIHEHGLVPKKLMPLEPHMTWEDYHNPKRITKQIEDLGKQHKAMLPTAYEQVPNEAFRTEIKKYHINTGVYAWPFPNSQGIYERVPNNFNHAILIETENGTWDIQDNYLDNHDQDYIKRLASNYRFYDYGYRIATVAQKSYQQQVDLYTRLVEVLNKIVGLLIAKKEEPKPEPKPAPANNLLNTMALAIQKHEGWILNPPSRSVRNNNPGNCRFSPVGYDPKYGIVKEDRTGINVKPGQMGFAIFKDYETGFLYLKNLILQKAKKHPTWTLYDFFGNEKEGWAPNSDDNNSKLYAETVAKAMNVSPTEWRLKSLLS